MYSTTTANRVLFQVAPPATTSVPSNGLRSVLALTQKPMAIGASSRVRRARNSGPIKVGLSTRLSGTRDRDRRKETGSTATGGMSPNPRRARAPQTAENPLAPWRRTTSPALTAPRPCREAERARLGSRVREDDGTYDCSLRSGRTRRSAARHRGASRWRNLLFKPFGRGTGANLGRLLVVS